MKKGPPLRDITGNTYNSLYVKSYIKDGYYLCLCNECGNETIASYTQLVNGYKKSCGCSKIKYLQQAQTKHGDSRSRLYRIYSGMKERCYRPTDEHKKKNYKDKGITICDEWLQNYENFKFWAMNNGYADNLTIERIDNNKGYSPDNCRWITREEQATNRSTNYYITIGEETHTMAEWCRINGISRDAACKRIEAYGWDPIRAVTQQTRPWIKNGPFSRKKKSADMFASKVDGI